MKVSTKATVTPKANRFVLRPYRRIPTWSGLYYLSGAIVGKGVVTNLSRTGLRVQGEHTLTVGTDLSLRLELSKDGAPVEIEKARVQWVRGCDFGLKIVSVRPLAAKQIEYVLAARLRSPGLPS